MKRTSPLFASELKSFSIIFSPFSGFMNLVAHHVILF
jgi:hypothetical protein